MHQEIQEQSRGAGHKSGHHLIGPDTKGANGMVEGSRGHRIGEGGGVSAIKLTFGQLRRGEFEFTKGDGCIYLLESKTLFKIGSTHRPHVRIYEQRWIGAVSFEERVETILISAVASDFRQIESRMKRSLFPWLATNYRRSYRPREVYERASGLLPYVVAFIHSAFDEAAWKVLTAACDQVEEGVALA